MKPPQHSTPKKEIEEDLKKEILKMSKSELISEKWKSQSKKENPYCSNCSCCSCCSYCYNCSNCSNCYNCSDCYNCSNCSYCSYCKGQKDKKYMIANFQFTKEEYEEWKKKI